MSIARIKRGGVRLIVTLALGCAFLGPLIPAKAAGVQPQNGSSSNTPQVTGVRIGVHGMRTRIVLDLDQKVAFNYFTLPEPYRVVLNLPEVGWNLNIKTLPKKKGLLKRMRYGLFTPGASRMVLDVGAPVRVDRSFIIKPASGTRWRLVLDLVPTTKTKFLKTLAAQRVHERKKREALAAASIAQNARRPLRRPLSTPATRRKAPHFHKHIIAIDPGHGGVDPGTISRDGTREKNITLALGRALKRALQATGRYKVVMTRNRDIFLRLRDRVKVAREAGAELFISLHVNSVSNHTTRGLSIYTLSEKASDREAAKLAAKENKSDLIAGIDLTAESPDVTNILLDLAQRETMNQSTLLAKDLVHTLRHQVRLLSNTHRFAGFAVLKAPDMPSVLVEVGFLSNRRDERNLLNPTYQRNLARAIVRGVDRHFAGIEEASVR